MLGRQKLRLPLLLLAPVGCRSPGVRTWLTPGRLLALLRLSLLGAPRLRWLSLLLLCPGILRGRLSLLCFPGISGRLSLLLLCPGILRGRRLSSPCSRLGCVLP